MSQIRVLSVEALELLGRECESFSHGTTDCLANVESLVDLSLEAAAERKRRSQNAVSDCADEVERQRYSSYDDDDGNDDGGYAMQEAEDALREAESAAAEADRAMEDLQSAWRECRRYIDRLRSLCEHENPQAIADLAKRAAVLREHAMAGSSAGSGAPHSVARRAHAGNSSAAPTFEELKAFALPRDFRWVRLDQIDLEGDLEDVRGPADFTKASYDKMCRGLQALRTDVLPAMQGKAVDASHFERMDTERGTTGDDGLRAAYEGFFSPSDPIRLSQGRTPGRLSIDSGRHRIFIARAVGWPGVPVRESPDTRDLP